MRRDRCQGCKTPTPDDKPDIRLRVSGWSIFEGALGSGKKVRLLICPQCRKSVRLLKGQVMDDQEELF